MNTHFALLARFESPVINLNDVCQEFFGITPKTARQKIKALDFPVPTFTLIKSERAPIFMKVEDLASYIDKQYKQAALEWQRVHKA
ncbi:pyocin activator PrtN family protein [Colwelliaceae bacterium MEBiC 14330]